MFPFFEIPMEVTSSRKLSAEEKLVFGSLRSWLFRQEPANYTSIADRVGMSMAEFQPVLRSLAEKGLIRLYDDGYAILEPAWLEEDAARFLCGPLRVEDPDGDFEEVGS